MSRCLAWGACAVTTALAIACVVLAIIEPEVPPGTSGGGDGVALSALGALMLTSLALVGAVVATRQPRNAVGWLLGLIPLSFGLLFFGNSLYWQLALPAGADPRAAVYAAWLANWTWIPSIVAAFALLPLLFRPGVRSRARWRPLVGIAIGAGAVIFAGTAFAPGPLDSVPRGRQPARHRRRAIDFLGRRRVCAPGRDGSSHRSPRSCSVIGAPTASSASRSDGSRPLRCCSSAASSEPALAETRRSRSCSSGC